MTSSSDTDLVAAALADSAAFAAIVDRYERPLLSFIFSRGAPSRADAEDLAQQVFIKAYQHLHDFDPTMQLSTWLFAIARNEVVSDWRRRSARPAEVGLAPELVDTHHALAARMGEELDRSLTAAEVRRLLATLKPDYRDALYLYFFEEKKYDEIADIMRRPSGSVATLIHRAKKAFASRAGDSFSSFLS